MTEYIKKAEKAYFYKALEMYCPLALFIQPRRQMLCHDCGLNDDKLYATCPCASWNFFMLTWRHNSYV